MYATSLFSFLVFYLRANTLWKSKGSSFTTAKNNDPRFYLFPVSGIECPVCTNVNGSGASKCDSGKVPKVTCPDGLDHCITLKGKMTVLTSTQDFEQKNCSNNASCDSASDYNGKNVTAKNLKSLNSSCAAASYKWRLVRERAVKSNKQILICIYNAESDRKCWNSVSMHVNDQKR